ncbi:hypothetical protein EDD85DRAFT_145138 [Armillaria nabsnona]|nr:hypothetical protein EDD85DRAFT_145138 [Armillaria nabsnona]
MQNFESSKLATVHRLPCEDQMTDEEMLDSPPSVEWFRRSPDSPFKRGVPYPKKTKSENVKLIPVHSSPSKDTLDSNPSFDTPLHAEFLSTLAHHKGFGSRSRTTTDERLEFFGNEEWVEVLSPTCVLCKACGKTCQLDKRGHGYYPSEWIMHRRKCVSMYTIWLRARGETDEKWLYRKRMV